jgi:hypothetical protein
MPQKATRGKSDDDRRCARPSRTARTRSNSLAKPLLDPTTNFTIAPEAYSWRDLWYRLVETDGRPVPAAAAPAIRTSGPTKRFGDHRGR